MRFMMTNRRGFTMVELLVAMFMLAAVGGATYALLVSTQRASRRQVEKSNLQDNVRAGMLILPAELREVGYSGAEPDLLEIEVDRIQFRAMRGVGFACQSSGTEVRVRKPILGYGRDPKVTDDILHFVEGEENMAADDVWRNLGLLDVDLTSTCPDNTPAIKLTLAPGGATPDDLVDFAGDLAPPSKVKPEAPVRFYEVMEMGLHPVDGRSWLGAKSVSATELAYQPVLGPLADGTGLEFTYYNATGAEVPVTTDKNTILTIRTIVVALQGRSDESIYIGVGGPKIDELNLKTRVALRNTLRP
jgi:prepilin-type N-terminal cleavage/methylation domain-containing protein